MSVNTNVSLVIFGFSPLFVHEMTKITFLAHQKRPRWLCFMSGISSPLTALRSNSQELFTVRRSTSWPSFVVVHQLSRDLLARENPSQTFAPRFWPFGRSPPGFQPPVSRFRTPASFWSQMATFQIWRETVKTRGGYPRKCVFSPVSLFFRDAFVSLLYLSCLVLFWRQTWQAACLVDGLQVCQGKWSDNESHVTYQSPKTSSQITYFFPRFSTPRSADCVLQLAFGPNWSHTKFGVKLLKPGGARVDNVFCPSCACALPNPFF